MLMLFKKNRKDVILVLVIQIIIVLYLGKRGTRLGDREPTGAVLLSLLAVPRIYPKSPLLLLAVAARVGAYPKSRLSLLELGLTAPQACVASRRRVCYP